MKAALLGEVQFTPSRATKPPSPLQVRCQTSSVEDPSSSMASSSVHKVTTSSSSSSHVHRARTLSPARLANVDRKSSAKDEAQPRISAFQYTSGGRRYKDISARLPGSPGDRHVFWTGGYDSTWRILQALLVEKFPVLPIYLSGSIDNYETASHKRRSKEFELAAMQAIRSAIAQCDPEASARLRDLVVVPDVVMDKEVTSHMSKLKAQDMVRRRRCQYGTMAQLTCNISTPVDISVVEGDFLWKTMYSHLEHAENEWFISPAAIEQKPELAIFRWLRFPLVRYSKESILQEATQRGYEQIMRMTWTCWYPRRNGEQCGKCGMCKHRILW